LAAATLAGIINCVGVAGVAIIAGISCVTIVPGRGLILLGRVRRAISFGFWRGLSVPLWFLRLAIPVVIVSGRRLRRLFDRPDFARRGGWRRILLAHGPLAIVSVVGGLRLARGSDGGGLRLHVSLRPSGHGFRVGRLIAHGF
jgi:hypothetical protein